VNESIPSMTALAVAFARGLAGAEPDAAAPDPHAAALLPRTAGRLLRGLTGPGASRRLGRRVTRRLLFGLAEHLELRTALLDRALGAAVAAGCRQVVLLGAGLDARAHRLGGLSEVDLFEVDHPATQAFKRRRAPAPPGRARSLRYVAVDFTRDSLRARLADEGLVPTVPTAWLVEGVTMYLPRPALRATLSDVASSSAPGSRLLLTYLTRRRSRGLLRLVSPALRASAALVGEPMPGRIEPAELAAELAFVRFSLLEDRSPGEEAPGITGRRAIDVGAEERLAVALRRSD